MHPTATLYRLSTPDEDAWIAEREGDRVRFPTVVAEREGEVVGYLGTVARDDFIEAGPMAVLLPEGRLRAITAMRMIEAYELILSQFEGIDHYFYSTHNIGWVQSTARCPRTELCGQNADGVFFFKRSLPAPPGSHETAH